MKLERLELYRQLQIRLVQRWMIPRLASEARVREERDFGVLSSAISAPSSNTERAWFHAASAGELESLWTVAAGWASGTGWGGGSGGNSSNGQREVILTTFSESARGAIQRLAGEIRSEGGKVVFAGYCPWEGHWGEALNKARPALFVTWKYEAWPELWSELARQGIPIAILGARSRRSLTLTRHWIGALGEELPPLGLFPIAASDQPALKEAFPQAQAIVATGDPRWDRVAARNRVGSSRAREIVARHSGLERPWGVLGQVWGEDIEKWGSHLAQVRAKLFVVPHKVDENTISEMEGALYRWKLAPVRSSRDQAVDQRTGCVLVDEMGILSELYAAADWAYIGGGFGSGVHSTVEPAIQGIPVACGPKNAAKFPEVAELQSRGQLTLVRSSKEIGAWLKALARVDSPQKEGWRADAALRLGATGRVLESLQKLIKPSA